MGKPAVSFILRATGVIDIVIGGLICCWLLTVGLYITLYSSAINESVSEFVYLFLALVLGLFFMLGGIGFFRKRARSRIYLNTAWGISVFLMALYVFAELKNGFSANGIGSKFFDIGSWLGGIIFWSAMIGLGILHIRFLNSDKIKGLLI